MLIKMGGGASHFQQKDEKAAWVHVRILSSDDA
jgi:hypothetical protein